jgi:superkiller protein 3
MEALSLLLPQSPYYSVLSNLPPADPTNPTGTTTMTTQMAMQDSLPVLEEIVSLAEKDEEEIITREVDKRRMRLGASGPEQLKREVGREVWATSQVGYSE